MLLDPVNIFKVIQNSNIQISHKEQYNSNFWKTDPQRSEYCDKIIFHFKMRKINLNNANKNHNIHKKHWQRRIKYNII